MFQVFHKRMPPEAIDLASRLLQYSPSLRCSAVSRETHTKLCYFFFVAMRIRSTCFSMPYLSMIVSVIKYSHKQRIHYSKICSCILLISWKHVRILSLMSFESPMLGFLMVVLCLHSSTLNRKYVSSCLIGFFY